nr:immunoglobulin heavy chain junction region [Macaca mulatta]
CARSPVAIIGSWYFDLW